MNTATKIEMIRNKTRKLLEQADEMYNLRWNVNLVDIDFKLRGRAAGMAWYRPNPDYCKWARDESSYDYDQIIECRIQYNIEAIEKDFDHVYNETVPHEIAHLVTWNERSRTGKQRASHGPKWKRVTIALGGSGKRCHSINLTKARKVREWEYSLDSGRSIILKTGRHNKIQKGYSGYRVVSTGESIRAHHFVGEVMS